MPAHDWTRVEDGIFHAFHLGWIHELQKILNGGLLPEGYFALGEQVAGGIGPDVLTLQAPFASQNGPAGTTATLAVEAAPPKVDLVSRSRADSYVARQRHLVIRHTSGHRIVATIEIVSRGNKSGESSLDAFVEKSIGAALRQGIHLLILDLHPPGPRDPQGLHAVLWGAMTGEAYQQSAGRPLTLVAYTAGAEKVAYVRSLAAGDALPDMPLFLDPQNYVNVPLEPTYLGAYAGVPRFYRDVLER